MNMNRSVSRKHHTLKNKLLILGASVLLIALLLFSVNTNAFIASEYSLQYLPTPPATFEDKWGGKWDDEGHDIALDSSGNIYITGKTNSQGDLKGDIFVLKYDVNAKQIAWTKILGFDDAEDSGNGIVVDGNSVIITGYVTKNGTKVVFTAKLETSTGDVVWNATWGGNQTDTGADVDVDSTGNIYVVGTTRTLGNNSDNVLVLKYDSDGNLEYNISWGDLTPEANDVGTAIKLTTLGEIVIGGYSNSSGIGGYNFLLVKLDSAGDEVWSKSFGGSKTDIIWDLVIDASNNVYVVGQTNSAGNGLIDMYVAKFSLLSEPTPSGENQRYWGDLKNDYGFGIAVDSENGIVYAVGSYWTYDVNLDDVLITKYETTTLDLKGNVGWGGNDTDIGYGVVFNDGILYITGSTWTNSSGYSDVLIVAISGESVVEINNTPGLTLEIALLSILVFTGAYVLRRRKKR